MRLGRLAVALVLSLGLAAQANAGTAYFNGVLTANSPTFDNPGGAIGLQFYDVTEFTVDTTGSYVIESSSPNTTGTPSNALDTFLRVYANSFNPATPAANLVSPNGSDDDFSGALTVLPGPYLGTITGTATGFSGAQPASRLPDSGTLTLNAGISYFLVNTSFRQTTFVGTGTNAQATGPYYTGIGGPGEITIVPEPATLALLGFGAMALIRRRRA